MRIYCSGIGGIGLSAYASLQRAAGHDVSGSDRTDSPICEQLRERGVTVFLEQDGSHVTDEIDLFVYSEAIPVDAPERERAKELGIPMQTYFEALGHLSAQYDVIAVCGTHGKSSTTAMLANILVDAGLDPTVVVGTLSPALEGGNWRKGNSKLFVVEACEYRRSFHHLSPDRIVLTTVDGDHFDSFTSIEDYRQAFVTFIQKLPPTGTVTFHGSDSDARAVVAAGGRTAIDADVLPLPTTGVPGEHMRQNAQLALAVAKELGVPDATALRSLAAFQGTWRRMEVKGETVEGVTVVDDYAHHPVEIRATLAGLRSAYPDRRIICIFQPHTHDRTLQLYNEFLGAFSDASIVIVPNVYNARSDIEHDSVDVARFAADIARESKIEAHDGKSLTETVPFVRSILQPGDILVTMGAGDVTDLAEDFLR